jgi:GNAT superfamily N-acetyltransferase
VLVRPATGADAVAIETIRVQGWRTAYRHVLPPAQLDGLPVDAERWRVRLERPPRGWSTLVVERDGHVIGFASTGPSRDELATGELYALYVQPDAWSTGAGRTLIAAAEVALARSYDEVSLWVLEENTRARRFYEIAGWEFDGTRKVEELLGVDAVQVRYRKRLR